MDANFYANHSDSTIQKNIANGWEFKLGDYISQGFKNTNNLIGGTLGFAIIAIIIIVVAQFIPIAGAIANALFLSNCLLVGFAMASYSYKKNGDTNFNNFWDGFKFVGPMATYGLLYFVVMIVVVLLAFVVFGMGFFEQIMAIQKNPGNAEMAQEFAMNLMSKIGILFLLGIGLMVALYPLTFVPFFIVFHGKNAVDSISTSYKLLGKNYVMGCLFVLLVSIIAFIGMLACFVGAVYTFPASRNMLYEMYADMTGLELEDAISVDNITDVNTLD